MPNIIVAGNIAAGKTTFVKKVAIHFPGCEIIHEPTDDNPFLALFYEKPETYATGCQLFFLASRLHAIAEAGNTNLTFFDRSPYEDEAVFARALHDDGYIVGRNWILYKFLHQAVSPLFPRPDLLLYLWAPIDVLVARIEARGREYEKGITSDYLVKLQRLYHAWVRKWQADRRSPVITLGTHRIDLLNDGDQAAQIAAKINQALER